MKYKIKYQINRKIYSKIVNLDADSNLNQHLDRVENIIEVKELGNGSKKLFSKTKQNHIYFFFKQLNLMLQSHLNLNEALELLKHTSNNELKNIITLLQNAIMQNYPLELVLRSYRKTLGEIPLIFLKQGIENGTINSSVNAIVLLLEKEMAIKKKIAVKLRYPFFLLLSLGITLSVIFLIVIPGFSSLFNTLGDNIPLATTILLYINESLKQYWHLYILFTLITFLTSIFILKKYNYFFDKILFTSVPALSKVITAYQLYKLFLSLYIIVKSKYQLQDAIESSIKTTTNLYLKKAVIDINTGIKNGDDIVELFSKSLTFEPVTVKLLYTAQITGQYESVLLDIVNYYEYSFNENLQKITESIEPIIILIIALIVLGLILAIMVPIWELSNISL